MNKIYSNEATRDRLLKVAIEVFSEHGFQDTTVREICTRANVNVASVNYYFQTKEGLYSEALAHAFQEANRLYPQDALFDLSLEPEQRLHLFVSNLLHKLLNDQHLGFHTNLITREIANPGKAFDAIIHTAIAPQIAVLEEIVISILNSTTDKTRIKRCVLSIFGQCLVFKHSRSIIDRLFPELIDDSEAIQACALHICQFSLAALTDKRISS
jgi:AcrR family transcriptional regulator